jgi:hypothetical protein
MRRDRILYIIAGVLFVLVVVYYGSSLLLSSGGHEPPERLAEIALMANTTEEEEAAAAKLADLGDLAEEQMAIVLRKSENPTVRAIIIQGLGAIMSFQNMDVILAELSSDSPWVRGIASDTVNQMLGFSFPADGTIEERREALQKVQKVWEALRNSPEYPSYVEEKKREMHERLEVEYQK